MRMTRRRTPAPLRSLSLSLSLPLVGCMSLRLLVLLVLVLVVGCNDTAATSSRSTTGVPARLYDDFLSQGYEVFAGWAVTTVYEGDTCGGGGARPVYQSVERLGVCYVLRDLQGAAIGSRVDFFSVEAAM